MKGRGRKLGVLTPLTVLTKDELAAWLKVSTRTIERLHIPSLPLDVNGRRYLVGDVLKWLEARKEAQVA